MRSGALAFAVMLIPNLVNSAGCSGTVLYETGGTRGFGGGATSSGSATNGGSPTTGGSWSTGGSWTWRCPAGYEGCACYGIDLCNSDLVCTSQVCLRLGMGGTTGAQITGGSTACSAGTERCDCYGNDTCNSGLVCASHLCVRLGTGGDTGTGGTRQANDSSPGAAGARGGNPTSGGATGTGSTSCGDGIVQSSMGEQCDFGSAQNTGEYGGCTPICTVGAHCGDGILQAPYEECDDGTGLNGNGSTASGCTTSCRVILLGPI